MDQTVFDCTFTEHHVIRSKKRGKKAEKEAVASGSESAADAGAAQPPAPANGNASARPCFCDNVHVPDLVKHRIEVVKRHSRLSKRMRAKLRRLLPWAIAAGLLPAAGGRGPAAPGGGMVTPSYAA